MRSSETFGVEKGYGRKIIDWINDKASTQRMEFIAKLYDYTLSTQNFGNFEMFSWMGDTQSARKLILKAGKRFKIRTIEGGYKQKERAFGIKKHDYAIVRRGDKVIGHLDFQMSRFNGNYWEINVEERR